MNQKSAPFKWVSLFCIAVVLFSFLVRSPDVLAKNTAQEPTPQPVVADDMGIVISGSNRQPALTSGEYSSASALNILCFTTKTKDPCTRIQSLFSNVTVIHSADALPANLSGYSVVYIGYAEGAILNARGAQFQAYAYNGGGLVVSQPNLLGKLSFYPSGYEITETSETWPEFPDGPGPVEFTSASAYHPILKNLTPSDLSGNFDTVPISTIGPGWTILARSVKYPNATLLASYYGSGRFAFDTGNIGPDSGDPGSDLYVRQLIEWAGSKDPSGPQLFLPIILR